MNTERELLADIASRQVPAAETQRIPQRPIPTAAPVASPELTAARSAREAELAAIQRQSEDAALVAALERSAGMRFRQCSLASYKATNDYQQRVAAIVRRYAATVAERIKRCEGLVLYGPVGTGKDHLAFAVAVCAVQERLSVEWLNGQDWFGMIRDAMDRDGNEAAMLDALARPDLLVISDPLPPIGNLSQHQATMLYRAVEARYSHGKPTIVTINVAGDEEADARMGAPTWDRLCDGAVKIWCQWESFRKPKMDVRP